MPDSYYKRFFARIENQELQRSITNIKRTAEDIWTDEVRIIDSFTDHGPEHSERIFEKLFECLWPDDAINKLNENELYVLILGIILHDIGMQCDVKKHREILNVAIDKYSASFQNGFLEGTAIDYSKEEQNEIRKNHHLLTAAWLDYSFCNNNHEAPTLAIDSVPDELRAELIDVCRFHSKLSISGCPEKSDVGHFRTQFIAALLRLGDELDIDRYRVNTRTVELFGFDIENSLFWYIHDHTKVTIDSHLIILQVILNKGDYELYQEYFQKHVIDEFKAKNHLLTEIIMSNSITIGISSKSAVVQKRQSKSLPVEIRNYLDTITDKHKQSNKIIGDQNKTDTNDSAQSRGEATPKKHPISNTLSSQIESSQQECIENILRYFCQINKTSLELKTDIEAVIVVWTDNHIKRQTFYSCNKPKGARLHNIRDYSFGVVGMLQAVIGNLDEIDKRADCILFYDHENNPTQCEYINDFRTGDTETRIVEEQEWKNKGTKAMLAISLFRQKGDKPDFFGALTFDFAETLKGKDNNQKESLFHSVRHCRDIIVPLLATDIRIDYEEKLHSLEQKEQEWMKKQGGNKQ